MRVRAFTQDDAHIFVMAPAAEEEEAAINREVQSVLGLMERMYRTFNLPYKLELSTRPRERIGSEATWDRAEAALRGALGARAYEVNEGDGAFYGPKIDVHVKDRLGRSWQCGTIQLDFNLPERFKLEYAAREGRRRPVMIHRVVLGSIERFIGILTEHYGGVFPLWLVPEQVRVVPVATQYEAEATGLVAKLRAANVRAGLDKRRESVGKRVRAAAKMKIPYTVVVGEKELAGGPLTVRKFQGGEVSMDVSTLINHIEGKVARREEGY